MTADGRVPALADCGVPAPAGPWPRRTAIPARSVAQRARSAGLDFWLPLLVLLAVGTLSAFSISGSSVGVWATGSAPDSSDVLAGKVRFIRSDEYQATTPIKTGRVRAGFPANETFGMGTVHLSDTWRPQFPSRTLGGAIFAPFNLPLALLPLGPGFALWWWLPFLACFLGVYAWLRLMRVDAWFAATAAVLVTTAPAAVWWSGWVCQATAQAVVPCAVLLTALHLWSRSRRGAIAVAALAALAAASAPWFYQPWNIPAALFAGGLTVLWAWSQPELRKALFVLAAVAAGVLVVEQAVYLLHERAYYEALGNTVYPGKRRESGGGVGVGKLLSSMFAFDLASRRGDTLAAENLSEIAMGWTVAAPIAAGVGVLARRALRADPERVLVLGGLALTALLSSWCLVRWPSVLAKVTLLTFVQPNRMAPFVGFFGVVMLALLFGRAERRARLRAELDREAVVLIAIGTMLVVAWGATDTRNVYLPSTADLRIVVLTLAVGVVIMAMATKWWKLMLGVVTAACVTSGIIVNPLMQGLGALSDAPAARTVRRLDRQLAAPSHGNWASDQLATNALLNAEGVRSLSSYNDPVSKHGWPRARPSGPVREQLEPLRLHHLPLGTRPPRSRHRGAGGRHGACARRPVRRRADAPSPPPRRVVGVARHVVVPLGGDRHPMARNALHGVQAVAHVTVAVEGCPKHPE